MIDTVGTSVGQEAAKSVVTDMAEGMYNAAVAAKVTGQRIMPVATPYGYILCVNCGPIGDPNVILFSQYATAVHASLKVAKGWDHYGLYSFDGKAAFQDCLRQHLEQAPPVGYLIVFENTDEGRDALPILERFSAGKPFRRF